jgi:hypothetical protein
VGYQNISSVYLTVMIDSNPNSTKEFRLLSSLDPFMFNLELFRGLEWLGLGEFLTVGRLDSQYTFSIHISLF